MRVFDGVDGTVALEFSPFGSGMTAGVRTATAFVDDDEYADIVAATGAGPTATVKVFSGLTGTELASPMSPYTPFGSAFTGGLFVAASNDPEAPSVTLVTLSPNPVSNGGSLTMMAQVADVDSSNGIQTPTGMVAFYAGFTYVGAATLTSAVAGYASAQLVYSPVGLAAGTYTASALYAGDSWFLSDQHVRTDLVVTSGGGGSPPPPPGTPGRPTVTGVSDDTGVSADDELTNDSTLDVFGTADAGSAVSVFADNPATGGRSSVGTVTASGAGTWTLTYATTLADGAYRFVAVAAAGGATSDPSVPLPVLVDTVAPTVSLAFDPGSADTSCRPTVRATARDPNGLGTTATLDIDFNGDGDFLDAGETGAATAAIASGAAAFASYPLLSVGTAARFRVRVSDAAGNEATSGVITRTPAAVTMAWSPVAEAATGGDDFGPDVASAGNASFTVSAGTGLIGSDCLCMTDEFVFSQQAADPTVAVRAAVRSDNGAFGLPDQILATLVWDGSVAATAAYDPASLAPGEIWHLALSPAGAQSTGRHTYTLQLFVDYAGTTNDVTTSVTDAAFVADGSANPLGAGVGYGGVDRLVAVAAAGGLPAGVLRVAADGRWTFYEAAGGGAYQSPQGDAGVLAADGGGYRYTSADGRTRTYDSGGKMVGWASRDGHERFTYTYDGSGRLATKQAPDGQRATFSYSTDQVAVEGAGGRRTTLTLSGGKLVGVATPDGGVGTFTYAGGKLTRQQAGAVDREWTYSGGRVATESAGGVTRDVTPAAARGEAGTLWGGARTGAVSDGLGNVTETAFDGRGRPTYVIQAGGGITRYTRDAEGRVTGVTDPLGQTTAVTRDAAGRPLTTTAPGGGVVTAVYSGTFGDLTSRTDELGRTTTAAYDGSGHLLTVTDPLGGVTSYTWTGTGQVESVTDPTGRVTTYVYDARRLVRTISGGVSSGTLLYDAAGASAGWADVFGATTTVLSDAAGRPVATTTPDGATATTAYDPATGLVSGTITPSGVRTSYLYDGPGRRTVVIEGVGSGLETTTTSVYDDAGRLLAEIAATGLRTTYGYDADGNVVAVTDPAGHTTRTVYDVAGRAVASIDALGRTSTTVYDADGRMIASVDPLGNRSTSVYDAAGNAVASIDPLGNRTTTVFDSSNRAVATVDALGNRSTTVYDGQGRAVAQIDALGRRSTTVYDARGYAEARVDALGNRVTTVYDDAGRAVAQIDALGNRSTTVYDSTGRAVAQVDALGNRSTTIYDQYGRFAASVDARDNRTTAIYDARDRRIGTEDALGHRTTAVLDAAGRTVATLDALGNATTTVYDPFGRAVATVDARGNRTTSLYDDRLPGEELTDEFRPASDRSATQDALGHVWASTADALGRTVSSVDPLGNTSTSVYDAAGNLIASIDALGNRTTTIYDALNRGVARVDALGNRSTSVFDAAGHMVASIDALGNRATTVYDLAGRAVAFVDALGRTSTSVYDAAGRTVASVDALGNRSTSVYDAAGRVIASVDALGNTTTSVFDAAGNRVATVDALGHRTTTVFDALNRPEASIDALGNRTTSIYDAAGRVTERIDALGGIVTTIYDEAGNATHRFDELSRITQTVYDGLNRPVAVVSNLGHRSTTVFDAAGRTIAAVDALGNRTTTGYDAVGRTRTVTDALGGVTSYGYDAHGNRRTVTDPVGNTTTFAFDALNREVTRTDPLNQSTTTAYDAAGQTVSITDRLGRRRDFAFDGAGRLSTEKWYAVGGSLAQAQTFTYDARGDKLTAADPDGTYTFAYDALRRVASAAGPGGAVQTFGYDSVGNRTAVLDSFGGTTTTAYDAANRIVSVEQGGSGVTRMKDTRAYTAAGELDTETRYAWSGSAWATIGVSTFAYDDDGRIAGSTSKDGTGAALVSYAYGYDAVGRITGETSNGALRTYSYDATSQVTGDTSGPATFTYDANGNRTMSGYATGAGNRVTNDGTWTYAYDAEGNLSSKTRTSDGRFWAYSYDHNNQMTQAVEKTSSVGTVVQDIGYGYDAFGNVIVRAAGGTTTKYAYEITDRGDGFTASVHTLWAELDGAGALTTRYLMVNGQAVARATASAARWLLGDRLGSVRNVTDNGGAMAGTVVYDTFGGIQSETSAAVSGNVLFTGGWLDRDVNLIQMHRRWLNVGNGQWTSEDPWVFEAGDTNLRRYASNDPSNRTDRTGLQFVPKSLPGQSPQVGGYQPGSHIGHPGGSSLPITYPTLPSTIGGFPVIPSMTGGFGGRPLPSASTEILSGSLEPRDAPKVIPGQSASPSVVCLGGGAPQPSPLAPPVGGGKWPGPGPHIHIYDSIWGRLISPSAVLTPQAMDKTVAAVKDAMSTIIATNKVVQNQWEAIRLASQDMVDGRSLYLRRSQVVDASYSQYFRNKLQKLATAVQAEDTIINLVVFLNRNGWMGGNFFSRGSADATYDRGSVIFLTDLWFSSKLPSYPASRFARQAADGTMLHELARQFGDQTGEDLSDGEGDVYYFENLLWAIYHNQELIKFKQIEINNGIHGRDIMNR